MTITLVTQDKEEYLGQMVAIENLPDDCDYKQQLLDIAVSSGIKIWLVAVKGHERVGDWAAYIGIPDIEYIKNEYVNEYFSYYLQGLNIPSGVKSNGWKLGSKTAKQFFPEYNHLKYRP